MRSTLIERMPRAGVFTIGSDVAIDGSVVRDTRPDAMGEAGRGIEIDYDVENRRRGSLSLSSSLIERNNDFGVFIDGSDATIDDCVVSDTQRANVGIQPGIGVNVQDSFGTRERGNLTMRSSLIARNQAAGVFVLNSAVLLESCVVQDTKAVELEDGFGDGIIVVGRDLEANVDATSCRFVSNARAGLLLVDSGGSLEDVEASGNHFGLVLQGSSDPRLGEGVLLFDNAEEDTLSGGTLAVPDTSPPLP